MAGGSVHARAQPPGGSGSSGGSSGSFGGGGAGEAIVLAIVVTAAASTIAVCAAVVEGRRFDGSASCKRPACIGRYSSCARIYVPELTLGIAVY